MTSHNDHIEIDWVPRAFVIDDTHWRHPSIHRTGRFIDIQSTDLSYRRWSLNLRNDVKIVFFFSGNRSSWLVPSVSVPEDDTVLSPGYRFRSPIQISFGFNPENSHTPLPLRLCASAPCPVAQFIGNKPHLWHRGEIVNFIAYSSASHSSDRPLCLFYSSDLAFVFPTFILLPAGGYLRHFEPKVARCKF